MKNPRGSITVEAAIVLPFYILVLVFLANFLNVFYIHTVIQNGLNNAASVLSQYCYMVDISIGMDKFVISEGTQSKVTDLTAALDDFTGSAKSTMDIFNDGITPENLGELFNSGKQFASAASNLGSKLKSIRGEDLVSYLIASGSEAGGSILVEHMVDDYLEQMKINRNLITGDIQYGLYVDGTDQRYDLVLKAAYCYADPMFSMFTDGFVIRQQAVVHPWIGGATAGLRKMGG